MFQSKTVTSFIMALSFMLGWSNVLDAYELEAFIARTWDEMERNGWTATGAYPMSSSSPSDWNSYLEPLDKSVTGGGVWMFNALNGRVAMSFDKFTGDNAEFCDIQSVKVYIKYFADNATMRVSPCTGVNCNLDPGDNVEWIRSNEGSTVEADLLTDTKLEVEIRTLPGGYVVFDQITITYIAEYCETTATPTPTIPTTTDGTVCPTIAPPSCDCCDRCQKTEVHHHHYYPYNMKPETNTAFHTKA